ncbi:hypothetical protein PIB30_115517, partial [Stylosanthes scabra]|nr:hypothetical protein [Stylosanthes scabra]
MSNTLERSTPSQENWDASSDKPSQPSQASQPSQEPSEIQPQEPPTETAATNEAAAT